jgi:Predicted nucleotide-binding protein containing TIR-like domain
VRDIFVGSSTEALPQARAIARVLASVQNVRPILWIDAFASGDITFVGIEDLAKKLAGAVFLATTDDSSIIRNEPVKTPRANVIFEYAYLCARLTRRRVALCRLPGCELPSDLAGLTFIPVDAFSENEDCPVQASKKLVTWALELPVIQEGLSSTMLVHGYSGRWSFSASYKIWRGITVIHPDSVTASGEMLLDVTADGTSGTGAQFGELCIQIGDCRAIFRITDRIKNVRIDRTGRMLLSSNMQSRQRMHLEGTPPQKDGFEAELLSGKDYEQDVICSTRPFELDATYVSRRGLDVYSQASLSYKR